METKQQSFADLVNGEQPVLVDFFAAWCGPCRRMPPILQEVKEAFGDDLTIIKVDINKNNELASRYAVQSVPTLILFQQGQIRWRQSGVVPSGQLKAILRQYI